MAGTYTVTATSVTATSTPATLLRLSFGSPAQNDVIVRDAVVALEAHKLEGGKLVLLNGPASLPVACALAHGLGHIFGAIGVFDPKMAGYVVAVSHDPTFPVGMTIPASEVKEG
ncbi:MAG: CRISPR-associated protein Csx3 [Patescibacteria group bacterium]